jgi:hypothetical protein
MTTDLERMLAEGLARYAESVTAPEGLMGTVRARRRRRLVVRACAAAGGVIAVAAATVLLATGGPAGEPRMLTDAYVVKQVQAALAAAGSNDGKVMHAITSDPVITGNITSWAYQGAGLDQLPLTRGLLVQGHRIVGRTVTYSFVDYSSRTWSRDVVQLRPGDIPPGTIPEFMELFLAPGCKDAASSLMPALSWPEYLRAGLACGAFRYAGYATVDGTRVLALNSVQLPGAISRETATLWVSPQTYLPVREVTRAVPHIGMVIPHMYDPVITNFQWLPPTPASIAKVSVTIPAGFRQVP